MDSGIGFGGVLTVTILVALVCNAACSSFNRSFFPEGFTFGVGSAAYQYEGAPHADGKGQSIWDTFSHLPGKIADGSNGDVANEFYYRYKDDINFLQDMNLDAFRFSISWPRILPNGSLSGGVNQKGIMHYNNLINELISKGLKPYATIFHWDTPQALEDKYESFLSDQIVKDYLDFADICFKEFGDRVKYWVTFNEPWTYCAYGYGAGLLAPGRCSPFEAGNCSVGDSSREPYIAAHHFLIAHGAAAKLYKEKYQATQMGQIGITLVSHWFIPYNETRADIDAAQRSLDFMFGWFMDPLVSGDYPLNMRGWLGNRLPAFTKEQSDLIKGSYDFIGVNYYSAYYVYSVPPANSLQLSYLTDARAATTGVRNGVAIGPSEFGPFYFYPNGLRELLLYINRKYKSPTMYITENGFDQGFNSTTPLSVQLQDDGRITFHYEQLLFVKLAIKEGVDVKGYFAWTFMDDWEWTGGFRDRFGFIFVNRTTLERIPKKSASWLSEVLKK